MKISQVSQHESRKSKRRKSKVRGVAYGPGPYGWYGTDSGYSGDAGGVAEAFDQPYKIKWEKGDYGDVDAYTQLPDGGYLAIMFTKENNQDNEEAWNVEFWRNNSQEVTGEGDAQRVFATVLGAIQTFIKNYKPNKVIFSASKKVEPGQNAESRAKLYDSLIQRYAKSWGFKAFRADTGNKVIYELTRIEKSVAEDSVREFAADDEGRVPPFTLYFVSNTPKGMEEDSMGSFASFDEALESLEAMYRDDPRTQNFWWIIRDGNKEEVHSDSPWERSDRARSAGKFGTLPPTLDEKWSEKYKRSINCSNPKGFSQRAHCQGRRKNEDAVNEFAPSGGGDGGDGFNDDTLKRLAAQWFRNDEDPRVEQTLAAAGWEIGWDEGYEPEWGVFVVQSGDVNGNSYISWPPEELKSVEETIDNISEQFWALMNSVEENFADGKKPGRKGLAKRSGVNCKQSVSKLRSIASKSSGERQRMAHWCANMKSGKKKSNENVNEADPNFVKFMNQTLANKIDKPDTQDDVPDFYKNAPAHELDGPYGGWGKALRWGIAVIQQMTPAQRERLALKGEKGVEDWLGRLAIKLKVMPDYNTEQGQRMIDLGQYLFVEEDLGESVGWLPEIFHDPNVRTWLDVVKQGTNLREEKETKYQSSSVYQVLKDFLPVAMSELKLEKLPKIRIVHQLKNGQQPTFGTFSDGGITLAIDGRHPVDICRTLAHELVHHKQRLDNRLNPNSGETGSDEENEANSVAGVIMRDFSREFPHHMSVS